MEMALRGGKRFEGETFPHWKTGGVNVQLGHDFQLLYD
jgi:hypothetical protein